ncbi:glucuronate isomerase [Nitratireductor sp. CAU 1489]|uniref:Uronate isomerase n=1 Tax=Nitratireductor arenosus TaxID=2682096 RepID=A0A844QF81_9HYPH|nr:glucuronate isomerase [Nitratireductor arenosus]MVA98012.1 glucuronate isomerase [Nitratireductor arenosus]
MGALLDKDRLFPIEPGARALARRLYDLVRDLPIVSPHGHTDPRWFARDEPFADPAELLVIPDHYVLRMLISQGVRLDALGVARLSGERRETDRRAVWRLFAEHYHLFRATPTRLWLDHTFETLFSMTVPLGPETADCYYDRIAEQLAGAEFRPRRLFERFNLEVLATTEGALDDLAWHEQIAASGWSGRVITTYRPDSVTDPDYEGFGDNLRRFGEVTGCDTQSWSGYLEAHRRRRAFFRAAGATATDHGHPTADTADLSPAEAAELYALVAGGRAGAGEATLFRAQMLTEMARMSVEDGMVMQIHAGARRNHSPAIHRLFGRDKGFDMPGRASYVDALKPMLDAVGLEPGLNVIVFTLDETAYARELAPLAGAYPCLTLGPPWWFYDSVEGMLRHRRATVETAGFYNTAGFNDDTRAFPSIPARHDVARRVDCAFLAELVLTGRLREDEAADLAADLAVNLARAAYRL